MEALVSTMRITKASVNNNNRWVNMVQRFCFVMQKTIHVTRGIMSVRMTPSRSSVGMPKS